MEEQLVLNDACSSLVCQWCYATCHASRVVSGDYFWCLP